MTKQSTKKLREEINDLLLDLGKKDGESEAYRNQRTEDQKKIEKEMASREEATTHIHQDLSKEARAGIIDNIMRLRKRDDYTTYLEDLLQPGATEEESNQIITALKDTVNKRDNFVRLIFINSRLAGDLKRMQNENQETRTNCEKHLDNIYDIVRVCRAALPKIYANLPQEKKLDETQYNILSNYRDTLNLIVYKIRWIDKLSRRYKQLQHSQCDSTVIPKKTLFSSKDLLEQSRRFLDEIPELENQYKNLILPFSLVGNYYASEIKVLNSEFTQLEGALYREFKSFALEEDFQRKPSIKIAIDSQQSSRVSLSPSPNANARTDDEASYTTASETLKNDSFAPAPAIPKLKRAAAQVHGSIAANHRKSSEKSSAEVPTLLTPQEAKTPPLSPAAITPPPSPNSQSILPGARATKKQHSEARRHSSKDEQLSSSDEDKSESHASPADLRSPRKFAEQYKQAPQRGTSAIISDLKPAPKLDPAKLKANPIERKQVLSRPPARGDKGGDGTPSLRR